MPQRDQSHDAVNRVEQETVQPLALNERCSSSERLQPVTTFFYYCNHDGQIPRNRQVEVEDKRWSPDQNAEPEGREIGMYPQRSSKHKHGDQVGSRKS